MRGRMASRDFVESRLPPILARVIERTEAHEIEWEVAALPDAFAVTIGDVRFRVRSVSADTQPPYALEFLGQGAPQLPMVITGPGVEQQHVSELVGDLYAVARASATSDLSDPFESVEQALGLESTSGDPGTA